MLLPEVRKIASVDFHYIYFGVYTKLNARLALRQRADLLVANISTDRISLPQGQSYTEGKYNNGSLN